MGSTSEWLVTGVLAKDQLCMLGGSTWTLRTGIAIDLALSLASGKSFLGLYEVPRPIRVAMLTIEDKYTITWIVKRIAKAKRIPRRKIAGLWWNFGLPRCESDVQVLPGWLKETQIELVILDAAYLCPSPLLAEVNLACQSAGATLLVIRGHQEELAAPQWMLLRPGAKGTNQLQVEVGGSARQGFCVDLDIEEDSQLHRAGAGKVRRPART
jgi:hypothetical protein